MLSTKEDNPCEKVRILHCTHHDEKPNEWECYNISKKIFPATTGYVQHGVIKHCVLLYITGIHSPLLHMYFIWRNPLRLHIIIKRIKTGISGFKPRITQESITILISTVVL